MDRTVYRYHFPPGLPLEEIEATLVLAFLAAESLHGADQVRLEGAHFLDVARRTCVIDAGTGVGQSVNLLFLGFVRREFGDAAVTLERLVGPEAPGGPRDAARMPTAGAES